MTELIGFLSVPNGTAMIILCDPIVGDPYGERYGLLPRSHVMAAARRGHPPGSSQSRSQWGAACWTAGTSRGHDVVAVFHVDAA